MRGASRKPTEADSIAAGSTRAERMRARRPGRRVRASARRPAIASERFSSRSGTTSAIVASATRSRCGVTSTPSACASLQTTPVPHSSGNGYADGRVATTGQSGSVLPGRWWSVTITSSPRARAAAISSTAVMPQSTVINRPHPSSASRAIVSPETP